MAKELSLSRGRAVALVDDDDFAVLSKRKWTYSPLGYAYTCTMKNYKKTTHYLHRVIMEADKGQIVDHINGNGLDNRRSNLRIGTQRQNLANIKMSPKNTSGYKGVIKGRKKWIAQIYFRINGKRNNIYIGAFDNPIDAAKAYDKKAIELHGEFARPNFPRRVAS